MKFYESSDVEFEIQVENEDNLILETQQTNCFFYCFSLPGIPYTVQFQNYITINTKFELKETQSLFNFEEQSFIDVGEPDKCNEIACSISEEDDFEEKDSTNSLYYIMAKLRQSDTNYKRYFLLQKEKYQDIFQELEITNAHPLAPKTFF